MAEDGFEMIFDKIKLFLPQGDRKIDNWSRLYFENNRNRYKSEYALVKEYHSKGRLLEIGAAPFHFTYLLKEKQMHVDALDIDPSRFEDFLTKTKLSVVKCDIENESLPFESETFDTIVFFEVFEHLRINPIKTMNEISRVLKNGGLMLVKTPNLYWIPRIRSYLKGKGFDSPYKEFDKLRRFGHMGHTRIYTAEQVRVFLRETNFSPQKTYFTQRRNKKNANQHINNLIARIIPKMRSHFLIVAKKERKFR